MTALCDLHTHTTASDGQYAPTELARLAEVRGLSVLAVTDHDTIAGTEEAISAGDKVIARPHFAQVMVKHGYVSTNREAFDRYLDTEEFRQKVKRFKADARTCVEAVKAAGGRVSLAHPYQMGPADGDLDELVGRPKGWGLDAIECYYPQYTLEQRGFYLCLQKNISSTAPAAAISTAKR